MDRIVGIGEYAISKSKNEKIKTFALGSCIAVTAYYPKGKIAGMAHIALPSPNKAGSDITQPCYYVTTAVPLLVDKMCMDSGCHKGELEINLFGGARSIRKSDVFKIGEKNIKAVKKVLGCLNLNYKTAEVGGTCSRTLEMDAATGDIKVVTQPLII